MKKSEAFALFFKRPNVVVTTFFWLAGLTLLSGCIAALVLDVWGLWARIGVILLMTLVVVYAAYGTAMLFDIPGRVKDFAAKRKYLSLFVTNYNARTAIYACGSVLFDVCYGVLEIVIGNKSGSSWFKTNGIYYLVISVIRFAVIMFGVRPMIKMNDKQRRLHEIKTMTATAIALLMLNSVLTLLFEMMITNETEFVKLPILLYGTAIYTF